MSLRKVATAILLALVSARASAFHSGGVGECDGCHMIHDSNGMTRTGAAGAYLLKASDPSSVCLNCHGSPSALSYSVFTVASSPGIPPLNYSPGGDFAWLGKSYQWKDASGATQTSPGERHGHNVVAKDYGLDADTTNLTAPGSGTGSGYPSNQLSCVSCHDPHGTYRLRDTSGKVDTSGAPIAASGSYGDGTSFQQPSSTLAIGVYRMLGGIGYVPKSLQSVPPFNANPPVALAPSVYNQSEKTYDVRVAYGTGMSEWCLNCHGTIHAVGSTGLVHPASSTAKLGISASFYNAYVKSGDLTNTSMTSYTSLVPYEEGTLDRNVLASHARSDGSALSGPTTGMENVMCLSCHRAHASGWDRASRWNTRSDLLTVGGQWPGIETSAPATVSQGRTSAETRAAMYDRNPEAYAPAQRGLCNKCHVKD
jgi:hypothetical protein